MGMVDFQLNIHAFIKLPSATQYYTLKEVCRRGEMVGEGGFWWARMGRIHRHQLPQC